MNRKLKVIIILAALGVSGLSLFLFVSGRLHLHPLFVCLTPLPSEATVVAAIRSGPGDGVPGVGRDGREYQVKPLECPHAFGSGTPKLMMHLWIIEQHNVLDEGVLSVGMVAPDQVVLFGFQSNVGKIGTIRTVGK